MGSSGFGCERSGGSGFALLVVLFILLIIIGACFSNSGFGDNCC